MSIGERITQLRIQNNISQGELAKAMGVSRQAVSKWENDLSAPDTIKLIQLADVLNTQVEYIATGSEASASPAPVVINLVEKVDKVVEKVVEKPVIRKVYRTRYLRNPAEFILLGAVCFLLGLAVGFFL